MKIEDVIATDLLSEVDDKNYVRVVVSRASRPDRFARAIKRVSMDDQFESRSHTPMLAKMDEMRALVGLKPIWVPELFRRMGSELVAIAPNIRPTVGVDYTADSLGKTASRPAVAEYIAFSQNAGGTSASHAAGTAPWNATNTADADATKSELAFGGGSKGIATYAHTTTVTSYTMTRSFTATATITAIQLAGLFNNSAANTGILFLESTFTSTTLATNDSLTLTWTVNI